MDILPEAISEWFPSVLLCQVMCVPLVETFEIVKSGWKIEHLLNTDDYAYFDSHLAGPLCCLNGRPFLLSPRADSRDTRAAAFGGRLCLLPPSFFLAVFWKLGPCRCSRVAADVNKWQLHGNRPFPPKIFLFSLWGAVTVPCDCRTTHHPTMTKPIFWLVLDWLKNFYSKTMLKDKKVTPGKKSRGKGFTRQFPWKCQGLGWTGEKHKCCSARQKGQTSHETWQQWPWRWW